MSDSEIQEFQKADSAVIEPQLLADAFEFSLSELADTVSLNEAKLSSGHDIPELQQTLSRLARILIAATNLAGSRRQALRWFKHSLIPGCRSKTPLELFSADQHEVLSVIIKNVRNSVHA